MSDRNPYYQRAEHVHGNSAYHRMKRVAFATMLFVTSYIAVVYVDRLVVYFSAVSFGYQPHIYFWRISDLPTKYIEWSKARVMLIFIAGSATLFILSILILLIYKQIPKSWAILKIFALWFFFNSLGLMGANLATSIFGFQDYSSVYFMNYSVIFLWWGIPAFLLYILIFLFSILLFITGYAVVNMLLRFSHSQRLVGKYHGRLQVIMQLYVLPFVIGSAVLLPFSFNNILFLACHTIALTLVLIGMIARINDYYELHGVYRLEITENKPWILALLSLLIALPVLNS